MKNISFAYLMYAGVSAAIAACSFYMVYLAVSEQPSSGAWLFAAFGFFFSVLPASALIRILASISELFGRLDRAISPKPAESPCTRFAPHWMMLIAMIVMALIILSVVIKVIRRLL